MKNVLYKIAKENDVPINEVRSDIQAVIHEAMKSTDPKKQKMWSSISKNGNEPTPEELIEHIYAMIKT